MKRPRSRLRFAARHEIDRLVRFAFARRTLEAIGK